MSSYSKISKVIEGFNLSPQEAVVYLKLLTLGKATIAAVAAATTIPRSSCYNILAALLARGLINEIRTSSRKFFQATDPESFFTILRQQEAALKEVLPELKAQFTKKRDQAAAYFYEDHPGIKQIFDDILMRQYPILAITSIEDASQILGDIFTDFILQRKQKHLPVKLLTYRSSASLKMKREDETDLRRTKFLSKSLRFKTANFVYGTRVATISLRPDRTFGLIIEDENIATTYRIFFELLWEQSSG